jgi:hypothetical protein
MMDCPCSSTPDLTQQTRGRIRRPEASAFIPHSGDLSMVLSRWRYGDGFRCRRGELPVNRAVLPVMTPLPGACTGPDRAASPPVTS